MRGKRWLWTGIDTDGDRAQFHGSAYQKQRISVCGSRELCTYVKHISWVSKEFRLVSVHTPGYTATAELQWLPDKRRVVIVSAEFGGKQSYEIGPRCSG